MELSKVRLTPYPEAPGIPDGWEPTAKKSTSKRDPLPQPYSWYGRTDSIQHDTFAALAETETGLTIDGLKALVVKDPNADGAIVDKVVKDLSGGMCRHCGWDLISKDGMYRLIWRDPRKVWVASQELTGKDFNAIEVYVPDFIKRSQKQIEVANTPKPPKAPKEPKPPKAPKAPKAPKEGGAAAPAAAEAAPGNQLAAVVAAGKMGELDEAIVAFCDPQIHVSIKEFVDSWGLEGNKVIEHIADLQRQNLIKSGFYKKLKDLAIAIATPPAAAPAAPAQ